MAMDKRVGTAVYAEAPDPEVPDPAVEERKAAAARLQRTQTEMALLTQAATALEQMDPEPRRLALDYLINRFPSR
jgi:hypothetical protein